MLCAWDVPFVWWDGLAGAHDGAVAIECDIFGTHIQYACDDRLALLELALQLGELGVVRLTAPRGFREGGVRNGIVPRGRAFVLRADDQ
jgi:hypothetical protein